jgi:two-component system chemotaxis response regulator CheY
MAILVVDDSRAMRMIVMRELRKAGYETRDVLEAENGRDALERIREGGVDLVLSDWNMPEMSGMNLLQALRRENNKVPFGFVTSESTPVMHRDALDAGADFVVTKPFSADSLSRQVELVLEGRRQADGLGAAIAGEQATLATVLEDLLGRPVTLTPSGPPRLGLPGAVAYYRSDTCGGTALLVAELGAAAAVGAALSRLPAAEAESYASEGDLPEVIRQNLHEVANVLSKIVPRYEERWLLEALRLAGVLRELPELQRLDPNLWQAPQELHIAGYSSGRAGFLFP